MPTSASGSLNFSFKIEYNLSDERVERRLRFLHSAYLFIVKHTCTIRKSAKCLRLASKVNLSECEKIS